MRSLYSETGKWSSRQVLLWFHTWSSRSLRGEPAVHKVWQHQGPAAGSYLGMYYIMSFQLHFGIYSTYAVIRMIYIINSTGSLRCLSLFAVLAQRQNLYCQAQGKLLDSCALIDVLVKKKAKLFFDIKALNVTVFCYCQKIITVGRKLNPPCCSCFGKTFCCCSSSLATKVNRSIFTWFNRSIYYTPVLIYVLVKELATICKNR